MRGKFRSLSCAASALAVAAMVLSGCAGGVSRDVITATGSDDVCLPQREALAATQQFFAEDIVAGAAIGALSGAALGALGAAVSGGDVGRGALVGAVTMGVAGAAAGYWNALQRQQGNNPSGLIATVLRDVTRENEQVVRTRQAWDRLVDCRRGEVTRVRSERQAGRITPSEANQRLGEIRRKVDLDLTLARSIGTKIEERRSQFNFAKEQVAPTPAARTRPRQQVAAQTQRQRPARVTPAAQTPAGGGQTQVAAVNTVSNQYNGNVDGLNGSFASVQQEFASIQT